MPAGHVRRRLVAGRRFELLLLRRAPGLALLHRLPGRVQRLLDRLRAVLLARAAGTASRTRRPAAATQRRVCQNVFRYGQCNTQIGCSGPVACRVVTCVPPYLLFPSCGRTTLFDNTTANHTAPCLAWSLRMTGLVIAEAVAIALLGLLVAGLLRSHAEILQALHELGAGRQSEHAHDHPSPAASTAKVVSELEFPGVREGIAPPRSIDLHRSRTRYRRSDIPGLTPWDESPRGVRRIRSAATAADLVAFLSTGCGTCAGFWDELNRPGGAQLPRHDPAGRS